jgi:rubrerythrin
MAEEQQKILEALQIAIQMEVEGKEFYLKASRESENPLGKKLLESLAAEEDVHQQEFSRIYNVIRYKKDWPESDFKPSGGSKLRTVFAEALKTSRQDVKTTSSEIDAAQLAIDMENKSFEFYTKQSNIASYDIEKEFYNTLAIEEREHSLILLDYYEYLKDPVGWFVKTEHPSLDGS